MLLRLNGLIYLFQSTLPRGERRGKCYLTVFPLKFQSTLPRGERRTKTRRPSSLRNFNPRSHEGSDVDCSVPLIVSLISIHAPTRGATEEHGVMFISIKISIHAPTRGATLHCYINAHKNLFQSTLPRGERQQFSPKSSLFSQQKLSKIFNLNNKLF